MVCFVLGWFVLKKEKSRTYIKAYPEALCKTTGSFAIGIKILSNSSSNTGEIHPRAYFLPSRRKPKVVQGETWTESLVLIPSQEMEAESLIQQKGERVLKNLKAFHFSIFFSLSLSSNDTLIRILYKVQRGLEFESFHHNSKTKFSLPSLTRKNNWQLAKHQTSSMGTRNKMLNTNHCTKNNKLNT